MTLGEAKELLDAEVICGEDQLDQDFPCVYSCDLMSDVLHSIAPGALLLTGLSNLQVVRTAEMAEVFAICFVRNKKPDPATVKVACESGIPVLTTELCMYEACGRLYEQKVVGCKTPA